MTHHNADELAGRIEQLDREVSMFCKEGQWTIAFKRASEIVLLLRDNLSAVLTALRSHPQQPQGGVVSELRPIKMQEIRLVTGEGTLPAWAVLDAVNVILRQRALAALPSPVAEDTGNSDVKQRAFFETVAVAALQRLIANYESQRDQIGDSDLDNEQPLSLTYHCQLGDIRNARGALGCYRAMRALAAPVSPVAQSELTEEDIAAIKECADDLAAEVEARYSHGIKEHPAMTPKYERDMEPVENVRSIIDRLSGGSRNG